MVPIYKKNYKNDVKNYRPVSLLPVLSKVLESIVASRVTEHLEQHHLLSNRQYGFRKGRSASDLHLLLTSKWSVALDHERATAVVALDIEGAFDKVWHEALIEGPLLQLFTDYLRERRLKVVLNGGESEEHPIKAGTSPRMTCPTETSSFVTSKKTQVSSSARETSAFGTCS